MTKPPVEPWKEEEKTYAVEITLVFDLHVLAWVSLLLSIPPVRVCSQEDHRVEL